jgi:hypothetical protein
MHVEGHRADYALRVVHQTYHLAYICLSDQVDYVVKRRMFVFSSADLHELDSALEVVDNLLVALGTPHLRSKIVFMTCVHHPKRCIRRACDFIYLREPRLLNIRKVNITFEAMVLDPYA